MSNSSTFTIDEVKDEAQLLRKLNDNVTAVNSTYAELNTLSHTTLVPFQFTTAAYANPYDAPFPVVVTGVSGARGATVVQIEKSGISGKTRCATAGVTILWSNTPNGALQIEAMTGLEPNTAYKGFLAVFV